MRNILLTFSVLAFILISACSAAEDADASVDETNTIPENGSYIIQINNIQKGDTLNSEVQVIEGGPIDMFLINSAYYETYLRGVTIDVIKGSYKTGITTDTYNYTFDTPGDYYLILDNSKYGRTAPTGEVNAHIVVSVDMKNQTNASIVTSTSTRSSIADQTRAPGTTIPASATQTQTPTSPGFGLFALLIALGLAAVLRDR